MSETLFPAIDKQFLTAKQIEEMTGLNSDTLRQAVKRNPELQNSEYSEIRKINGRRTRVYFEPIISWLKNYVKYKYKVKSVTTSRDNVTDKLAKNSQNSQNDKTFKKDILKIFTSKDAYERFKSFYTDPELKPIAMRIDKTMGWEGLPFVQTKQAIDTPKPIDKPKIKDKPLTRRQALHSLIVHYADAKGITYNKMYSTLYAEYFGYSRYYELSQECKNLMDYIEKNGQLDNFAEFVRSKLSE